MKSFPTLRAVFPSIEWRAVHLHRVVNPDAPAPFVERETVAHLFGWSCTQEGRRVNPDAEGMSRGECKAFYEGATDAQSAAH